MANFPKSCPEHNENCPFIERSHPGWHKMTFTDIQCSKPSNKPFAELILDLQQYHHEALVELFKHFKSDNTLKFENGPTIKYQHKLSWDVWETMVVQGAREVVEYGS